MRIVSIPMVNGLGKTSGVEEAPSIVLSLLDEVYSNERGMPIESNFFQMSNIGISGDLEVDNDLIYRRAFDEYENKDLILFLGGDHSVSYPLTRAFFDHNQNDGKKSCVIVFDAHPDCMRPVDRKIPTHEEWLRDLIEDGFNPKNILLVGSRNADPSELRFLKEKGVDVFSMDEIVLDYENKLDAITEFGYGKEVYVSLDIDCVDPAFAPGTGYCEPCGMTSREFLHIIKRLRKMKNLRALDLVEINPSKDINNMTSRLGAKIISELL